MSSPPLPPISCCDAANVIYDSNGLVLVLLKVQQQLSESTRRRYLKYSSLGPACVRGPNLVRSKVRRSTVSYTAGYHVSSGSRVSAGYRFCTVNIFFHVRVLQRTTLLYRDSIVRGATIVRDTFVW